MAHRDGHESAPPESPDDVTAAGQAPAADELDPELVDDLGDELGFRGDVLEAEIEQLRAEAVQMRDVAQRVQAEFENFRKRTAREREDERARAAERVVLELLPVIDNLERAIAHAATEGDESHLFDGVRAVHKQIIGVLEKEGATLIDPLGEEFDPLRHHAIAQRPDADAAEGTVIEVFQKGYEMGSRVVRPAMVVVAGGKA